MLLKCLKCSTIDSFFHLCFPSTQPAILPAPVPIFLPISWRPNSAMDATVMAVLDALVCTVRPSLRLSCARSVPEPSMGSVGMGVPPYVGGRHQATRENKMKYTESPEEESVHSDLYISGFDQPMCICRTNGGDDHHSMGQSLSTFRLATCCRTGLLNWRTFQPCFLHRRIWLCTPNTVVHQEYVTGLCPLVAS